MNESMRELWTRIEAFEIDDLSSGVGGAPELTFAERLARENGWSVGFARRVVGEYKKFLFLAMTAAHPVTPSDEVDQAWHLHMTYTRSYWDRLTRDVLPRPLHHDPTRGGGDEDAKFDDWYAKTKQSYAAAFGEPPPADIWPSSTVRFDPTLRWQRVNAAAYWMVPKRKTRRRVLGSAALLGVAAAAGGWGTLAKTELTRYDWIAIAAVAIAILFVVAAAVRHHRRKGGTRRSDSTSSGCGGFWGFGCGGSSGCASDGGSSGCGGGGCGGGGGD